MKKDVAQEINELITGYLNEKEADDFDLGHEISNFLYRKAKDQDIDDQVKLVAQSIPVLLKLRNSSEKRLSDLHQLLTGLSLAVHNNVYEIFIHETKIKITNENDQAIYNFFAAKECHGSNQSRKEGLAVLIDTLQKAHDTL